MKREHCQDLDSQGPGTDGKPRGPTLCVLYPNCRCGKEDVVCSVCGASGDTPCIDMRTQGVNGQLRDRKYPHPSRRVLP